MTPLEELTELAATPYNGAVKEWKERGEKVVGLMCAYVPEEILPFCIMRQHFNISCSLARLDIRR